MNGPRLVKPRAAPQRLCMSKPLSADMNGRVAVVTGAAGGIGKEIAAGLARMGATVIIGARSRGRGEAAREEVVRATGNENVLVMPVDVSDMRSIEAFAAAFLQIPEEHRRVATSRDQKSAIG